MKKISKTLLGILLCFVMVTASSCKKSSWNTEYFTYFNTNATITLKDYDLKENKNQIETVLSSLENGLSVNKTTSPIYAFNNATKNQSVTLSSDAIELINTTKQFNDLIKGKFSVAVYPLLDLWQFTPEKYGGIFTLPSNEQIEEVKPICNIDLVLIDPNTSTAVKTVDGIKLDFGGVAKGYALTKLVDLMKDKSPSAGYINLGGSSIYVYSVPDYLAISHPRDNGDIIRVLPHIVENSYIGTSGDYQRFYVKNGVRYSHIIDLVTGKPTTSGFISVTVVCDDGPLSDMLSTALSTFSYQEMVDALSHNLFSADIFAVYLKDGKKEILTNKKQGDDFTLLDTEYTVVEI